MSGKPEAWSEDALARLLGARDGTIHALIKVREHIARYDPPYTPIPPHHVRRLSKRKLQADPLRLLAKELEQEVANLRLAYDQRRLAALSTQETRP